MLLSDGGFMSDRLADPEVAENLRTERRLYVRPPSFPCGHLEKFASFA